MTKHIADYESYEDYQTKALELIETIEGEDGNEFHFEVRGRVSFIAPGYLQGFLVKKAPAGAVRINEHEHGDYIDAESFVENKLRELYNNLELHDGRTQHTNYFIQATNMTTGKGLRIEWTGHKGTITETTQEPRRSNTTS